MTDEPVRASFSTKLSDESAGDIERAIVHLERLMAEHPADESKYQAYFENHPVALYALGYSSFTPRPHLHGGRSYEPDFLAVRPNGLVEVVELKTPAERILLGRERRERWTAKIDGYVSQVHEYREYFDELAHRDATEVLFGIAVQPRPDGLIIVGRDCSTDKYELHRQLSRKGHGIRIITFDDVLAELERTYSAAEATATSLPGATLMLKTRFAPYPSDRRRYLCDVILTAPDSRWSIYLNENGELVFEIVESSGDASRRYDVRVLPTSTKFDYDKWMLVTSEFGSSGSSSFLRIRIDDEILASAHFNGRISVGSDLLQIGVDSISIGSDVYGKNQCNCAIGELRIYDVAFDFRSRLSIVAEYSR